MSRSDFYGNKRSDKNNRFEFDPPLDPGIADEVILLYNEGVETIESCEGGDGHAYPEPTIRFCGQRPEGFTALAIAMRGPLRVFELRRVWPILDGEPTGPWWELVFFPSPTKADEPPSD